jgi:hypothetical protein
MGFGTRTQLSPSSLGTVLCCLLDCKSLTSKEVSYKNQNRALQKWTTRPKLL